jgi:hypothetical protein
MKKINQVFQTKDYSVFKLLKGNRIINEINIERLKKSFSNAYLLAPIIVNKHYEIIDGQHRFAAAKDLGLPINFIVEPDYGLREVQILNTNMKNWQKVDYLHAFCDLGYEEYIKMKEFMEEFPDFGISAAERILINFSSGSYGGQYNINGKARGRVRSFENGNFFIPDLQAAYDNARKILDFKNYYEGFNRTVFVATMIGIFKNENYDHQRMIARLKANPTILEHCSNIAQYKLLLEEIYNFRSRDKVSLRF